MIPNLTALVRRLARSPLPARLLALGGMLSALTLALVALDLVAATAWAARIGILIGGGAALMALPKWLGWPDRTLSAVALVVLVIVVGSRLLLVSSLPAQTVWALRANEVWLVLVFGSCVLLLFPGFLRRRSSLFGTLASGLGGLLLVSVGAESIGIGAMAWGDLAGEAASELSVILLAACAVWMGAFLLNRLEAGGPCRRAGRLLAWRSVLLRLGGVVAGVSAGLSVVPAATNFAWASAFATPLEGMAAAAGYLTGALTGVLLATLFAVLLPRLLARLQLSGMLAASAAGESGWFAVLAFLPVTVIIALAGMQPLISGIAIRVEWLPYVWPIIAAVFAHTLMRLLLGRVPESSATPLWLFLPEAASAPATLACALQAAREWSCGPLALVAPAPVAPRVRGAHLRLAQQAGLLPALFANRVAQAAAWRSMRMPAELAWNGLPCSELYGGAAAWQAAVDALQNTERDARVLVIDGNSTPGWGDAFWKALPAGSELLARQLDGVPQTGVGVLRDSADFSQASLRSAWLAGCRERNAPRARGLSAGCWWCTTRPTQRSRSGWRPPSMSRSMRTARKSPPRPSTRGPSVRSCCKWTAAVGRPFSA